MTLALTKIAESEFARRRAAKIEEIRNGQG
jgi:hypothetical protein